MQHDKTTLSDLSIFTTDGRDVFSLIDHTTTQSGRDMLRKYIQQPPVSFVALQEMQDVVKFLYHHLDVWPSVISNGTLVMLDKYFETADATSAPPSRFNLLIGSLFSKLFNKNEIFFTQFSLTHIADLLKGCQQLTLLLKGGDLPPLLERELRAIEDEMQHRLTEQLLLVDKKTPYKELAKLNYRVRREMKHAIYRLIYHYSRLDAWQSMARATVMNNWVFPQLCDASAICMDANELYHPLLPEPIPYSISFDHQKNFMVLTGANMSGKTTFMRALGVSALLAHTGMGVPAKSLRISFLQGIITNMHVEDNLMKGESYFFAEVLRMKHTAEKLLQDGNHLVLMDELFKGTNVHDAYECTRAIVEGLLQRPQHMMILSTHLYEVAQHFNDRKDILFKYFVTQMDDKGNYRFSYKLHEGISNDRMGYRILQKEGVIDMLKQHIG
ncbi:MAG: DNA mismatch repair protein MutS [Bacteroidota bacterium]